MNTIDLHGRSAVVTSAARGIGRGMAERLLASGHQRTLWHSYGCECRLAWAPS